MSSKDRPTRAGVHLEDVFDLLAQIEQDYGVHCHYVIRRDFTLKSKRFGYAVLFARRLGVGDEARTLATVTEHLPSSSNATVDGVLFRMGMSLACRLDEAMARDRAEQADLFSPLGL